MRLFCFPYAGGGPHTYRSWPDQLPKSIEVLAAQFPGRGGRLLESPFTELAQFVEESSQSLLQYSEKPFAFFGHSMGALVSFQLTCFLRRENRPLPLHLFLSGRAGPRGLKGKRRISELSDSGLIEELGRFDGTPEEVLQNAELMSMMLPSIRADFLACESYVHGIEPPLPCSISAFAGLPDREVSPEQLEEWRRETSGSFSCKTFPGGHFYLNTAQTFLLETLANTLLPLLVAPPLHQLNH
jgi:medium-chain acyl-[acyl-carrier-protein] hydrolase